MSSVSRIITYIDFHGIKKSEFYLKTGLSNGYLDKVKELGADKIESIIKAFPNLNLYWLITGNGEMMSVPNKNYPQNDYSILKENTVNFRRKLRTDIHKEMQSIPLYPITATAGILDIITDTSSKKPIPVDYISIPNMPKCDGALPITGDSMYPLLKSGDIVLFKEVHDKNNIIWGEIYLAAIKHNGDDFFFTKYIQKSEKEGYAKFVSENRHHQPVEFPIDSIVAVALIKASIRFQSSF